MCRVVCRVETLPLVWFFLFSLAPAGIARGQGPASFRVNAATRPAAGNEAAPPVVLTWPDAATVQGWEDVRSYNLYRKVDIRAPYPLHPINTWPLEPMKDCNAMRRFLAAGGEWSLLSGALAGALDVESRGDGLPDSFDPCHLDQIPVDSRHFQTLQWLVHARWKIAVAVGQGYSDENTLHGRTYHYELRGVRANGLEVMLATNVTITAGVPEEIPPPDDLASQARDAKVLLVWSEVERAAGFRVYRALMPGGQLFPINEFTSTSRIEHDLDGKKIRPGEEEKTVNGFVDYQRWDASSNPIPHAVGGVPVDGPRNGLTYHYRVASVDLLGNEGPLSGEEVVTPVDTTPPRSPAGVTVTPRDEEGAMEICWVQVTRDIDGHPELLFDPLHPGNQPLPGVRSYVVYRYENAEDPSVGATLISGDMAPLPKGQLMTFLDTDSALRPDYGEKVFWYRIACVDAAGNESARSGAVSGHLKDTTPPAPPAQVTATGLDELIRISWPLSPEPDVAGYRIYRNLCDRGVPCSDKVDATGRLDDACSSGWLPIGYVTQMEAAALATPFFEDLDVPTGTLCYAYLVKAEDRSQNTSGNWPPDPDREPAEPIVCERLRDRQPPAPAVITGLTALDGAILVEWIGPPEQDILAYYVYRCPAESGAYEFVGGQTAGPSPETLMQPVQNFPAGCDIPLEADEEMSRGSFRDESAQPKKIYWYRVLGVDRQGNIGNVNESVPVSTFTFSTKATTGPGILSVTASGAPCGLVLRWSPAFNENLHLGFAVLRSTKRGGPFRQVGSIVSGQSQYTDTAIRRGTWYWYRVLQIDRDGKTTAPSGTAEGLLP